MTPREQFQNQRDMLKAAELMAAISRGRKRAFWKKALTVQQALLFLQRPNDYLTPEARQTGWVEDAIAIAKLICEGCAFLDENICPIVRKL